MVILTMVIKWEERKKRVVRGPLSPQSDNMLLIAREEGGRRKSVVRRIADMQPAAAPPPGPRPRISLARMPEASRYMRRRKRKRRTMRRDDHGRSGEIDFFNQGR